MSTTLVSRPPAALSSDCGEKSSGSSDGDSDVDSETYALSVAGVCDESVSAGSVSRYVTFVPVSVFLS